MFRELWEYRELFYFLAWRDIKVRYKQTVLGIGWSVLQPFLTMVVFTIFFGRLAKVPSDGVPYPVGRQGPSLWSPMADKEHSVRNCWASSLQIYRQNSGNSRWQGQESFSPLFGHTESQCRGSPIYILQRQISHLVGPQRQFREAQCHGVIPSADGRGAIKAAQKSMSRTLVQNYQRRLGGRACRRRDGTS